MDLTKMGMIQLQNPSHPTGLLCKANQMRLAGTLCDVVIMVDSQEFHAHRTVLACTSKMFEILFHRNSQHYTLDFLSPKTFQQILEYAYTATLQAKAEDLDDLLYAAEILEIEYLEEQCLKILETIQASDDNDTEATMAEGGAEEEEDRKARYLKNIFISKHSSEESGYASVAAQSLPGPMVDQSPSVSTSFGLSAMSPTKAAVDSLMTIGQSLLQGALQPPAGPEEPTLAGGGRHPAVAEVKPEMMQVDEVPGQESPGTAESSISAGMGDKVEERGKEGPGTPTRSSVITSARELHYGREESAEQLPPPVEAGQGPPGRLEPPAPPAEKHLGLYSVLPNHKADAVLSMPSSVTSGLHVQPALAVSMDFSTYGGLLPQGFIQRELFSKLGELAVGMKAESRTVGEQCSVCGVELPDNEAVEQHRLYSLRKDCLGGFSFCLFEPVDCEASEGSSITHLTDKSSPFESGSFSKELCPSPELAFWKMLFSPEIMLCLLLFISLPKEKLNLIVMIKVTADNQEVLKSSQEPACHGRWVSSLDSAVHSVGSVCFPIRIGKLHSGMKTYGCELCGKRFLDSLRLRMHLLAHSGPPTTPDKPDDFSCQVGAMGLEYYGLEFLKTLSKGWSPGAHQLDEVKLFRNHNNYPAGAKAFVCDQCGAQFSKEEALETHRQTHTGTDMAVFCLLCGKRFQAQSALQQHMEVHAGVRSYICSECNRTFPSHTALKRHLRSHTGDHPYECEFCGSCFRDESTLKSHKRIHTGEKPYECNGCGKKFSLKHQLETHYRVHTGEKPFECKLCHQRSRDYSAMIKHLRTHNGASPYQCTICSEYCPSLSSMQKHMKGHKPEEIPPDWRIEKTYLYLCYV
ncbi:hypothetical protein MJG53_010296 [Ovis ammon polii x Ovis aries]|uniref:Uncharacterized protein n=1 Tax=Ovis ammon polii x Ovis aries TaxID=2918886 RepID=A0ACB9UTA9_9CETA|nr:hypothetical protein MJG53_010296 [Ovis ammon polii x Ovis aries]